MRVLKFGGTSVGSIDSLQSVKSIILKSADEDKLIVVFSAFGGLTNSLERAAFLAGNANSKYENLLSEIEQKHVSLVKELLPVKQQGEVIGNVKLLHNKLEDILRGVFLLKELSPKSKDTILSYGEKITSCIFYPFLKLDIPDCQLLDPQELIYCDDTYGKGVVDHSKSSALVKDLELPAISICPGFIASSSNGDVVTLGRGGSDFTAALFANYLEADELQIWTDVDGLMTADPRWITSARVIEHLSYEEALELSHFGAKVIYPPSVQPALEKNIPIQIRNTFKPESKGTSITRSWEDTETIRGISSINKIALLNLSGSGMVGIPSFSSRLFQALSESKVNVILITQASSEHTISVGIDEHDKNKAVQAINKAFENEIQLHKINPVEVEDELAVVALVGSNMKNQVGVAGKMFNSLGRNGVSIKAIAQGSSERNISVVIENHDLKKAVNVLHETFFTGEIRRINLFIVGVGNVGSALLSQIKNQINYLKKNSGIELRVVGLANSRKMLIDSKGISLESWTSDLHMSNEYSIDRFIGYMIELNLRNSLFIDITASNDIADRYMEILKESISVVTPNKIAATSPFQHYQTLKFLAKKFSCQFLFETNVCAGLPVISTLNDLVKSGDRIHSIEGVFSGTLNFIFNQYNGEVHFSDIVKMAKSEGYTEPDPRLDLSGSDVMRKILILVRESGLQIEFEDVQNEEFVPEECMKQDDIDEFFGSLEKNEEHFRKIYQDAESESKSLRYVASWDRESGIAKSGLKKVGAEHPFYNLEGKDNIVVFYTDRYKEQPLIIKGAGAGADVTASGIFADIMRVANSNN